MNLLLLFIYLNNYLLNLNYFREVLRIYINDDKEIFN